MIDTKSDLLVIRVLNRVLQYMDYNNYVVDSN